MSNNAFLSEDFSKAFAGVLSKQPSVVRRKDSINNIFGAVLQLLNIVAVLTAGAPLWVGAVIAAVIGLAQVVYTATTEGPVTPSQERKILAELNKIEKPELRGASALNLLTNIWDAVEIQRAKERGADGYGLEAVSEKEEDVEVEDLPTTPAEKEPLKPETSLDALRNQISANLTS